MMDDECVGSLPSGLHHHGTQKQAFWNWPELQVAEISSAAGMHSRLRSQRANAAIAMPAAPQHLLWSSSSRISRTTDRSQSLQWRNGLRDRYLEVLHPLQTLRAIMQDCMRSDSSAWALSIAGCAVTSSDQAEVHHCVLLDLIYPVRSRQP